jgi:hypothetical protein
MRCGKRDFSNPSASSIRDEAFSCFGIGGVWETPTRRREASADLRFREARQG